MEKQEQEERKHIEALDSERSLDEIIDLIRNADEWIQAGFSCEISGSSQCTGDKNYRDYVE